MNGMYGVDNDRKETRKLMELNALFQEEAQGRRLQAPDVSWLWIGACINCYCLLCCSVAMCLLFVTGDGPKDVLLDCFSLTFLYNLDDIGGDLAFLDEKWDEDLIGDMYGVLRDIPNAMDEIKKRRKETWTPDNVYRVMKKIMWVMLVLMPLAFVFVDMKNKAGDRRLMVVPGVA